MKTNRISGRPVNFLAREAGGREHSPWRLIPTSERGGLQEDLCYGVASKGLERSLYTAIFETSSPKEAAARIDQNLRIGELERSVRTLQEQMHVLEEQLAVVLEERLSECLPAKRGTDPRLADVLEITQEMFGGSPEVCLGHDPEYPDASFVVFTVRSLGNAAQIVDDRLEWHDRVDRVTPGNSGAFRLSIIPE